MGHGHLHRWSPSFLLLSSASNGKVLRRARKEFFPTSKSVASQRALLPSLPLASSMNEADPGDAWIYQFGERTNLFLTHESESIFNAGNFFLQLLGSASTK